MTTVVVTGYITRRRCIGKKLAFADIQLIETTPVEGGECDDTDATTSRGEGTNDKDDDIVSKEKTIQVVFHRGGGDDDDDANTDNTSWREDLPGNLFPEKNTALPYGGLASLVLCESSAENRRGTTKTYHVKSWELLRNPRDDALEKAKNGENDGISCTKYLKSRGDAFLKFNLQQQQQQQQQLKTESKVKEGKEDKPLLITDQQPAEFPHGDNRAKALRAKLFAEWLVETYGLDTLASNGGILDVAGGKGKLSIELSLQGKIPCTIVDPLVRKHGEKLEPRDAKRIRKAQAPHPTLLPKEFNQSTFLTDCEDRVMASSMLVGLHPDECTEDILDVAIRYNKPVAIVPCCVFSGFFPLRTLPNGKAVRTYEDFLEYLLSKDTRLRKETLGFEGRNIVIYLHIRGSTQECV